jgi:hypothetical protein
VADQKVARYALKQWGDASGIRFLETKSGDAGIKFSWFTGFFNTSVAYAEFPELYTPSSSEPGEALERMYEAGNVYLNTEYKEDFKNTTYKTYALLHEIGHALGLKHPFHTSLYNKKKLSKADDHTKNTVMSYDNGTARSIRPSCARWTSWPSRSFTDRPNPMVSMWHPGLGTNERKR